MKLHLDSVVGQNRVTAYGSDYVAINGARRDKSLIVMPERIIDDWLPAGFASLTHADFEFIATLAPELFLLGTGAALRFPHPRLSQALAQARIGMEVMDTGAACRTFNILVAEGRRVAAALLID